MELTDMYTCFAGEYKAAVCTGRGRFDQVVCVKCNECPAGFYKEGNCDSGNVTVNVQCKQVLYSMDVYALMHACAYMLSKVHM
jgi:hypothetical protein